MVIRGKNRDPNTQYQFIFTEEQFKKTVKLNGLTLKYCMQCPTIVQYRAMVIIQLIL